jgi:hypothetical protein
MLSTDPEKTKELILATKPAIKENFEQIDPNFLSEMINLLGFFTSVIHKTEKEIFFAQAALATTDDQRAAIDLT